MNAITPQPSCADPFDKEALPVQEALHRILDAVEAVSGYEKLALRSALGRILAQAVVSPMAVPAHTNAAVDGYAVRVADAPLTGTVELRVIGTAWAGSSFSGRVEAGEAVRIMTGAVVPPGADSIVMQEHAERDGDWVRIGPGPKSRQNIRLAGEDLAAGMAVLEEGRRLSPADLGLLASLGITELRVRRRLRVAFFSTGDELRSLGEILAEGEIYDSNRYTLYGMLQQLGVELLDMGVVRDRREDLAMAIEEAARHADVIITSGGVSVGEADFIKEILAELGQVNFWKIAMKPGRPLAFGRIGKSLFFGLPGNPVSVMVTYYEFVQPALRRMMGEAVIDSPRFKVPCATRLRKKPGRTEFQRGILETQADGSLMVRGTGDQGSGILRTMSRANCLIVLPHDGGTIEPGTWVDVQPFHGLM
ncbi:MAG: molybdopterin molybdotransferase MoeA [Gammaproteobacteria bacterium]|nr:molybdopterin molybdotransferase MoeA [Gammaproteobacteria bacterium]MCP5458652.1 molybdopterin molybdotransferase MoeA [Gammaproteobacteria bacterium]